MEQSQCLGPLCKTCSSVTVLTCSKIPVLFIIVRPKIYDEFQWVMVQLPISALIRHLDVFRLRLRPMFSKSFEEMGIPQGYGFKQLLFSLVANALVLHTCSASDNWRPERLFYRHLAWDRYRIMANPDDLISQESPFLTHRSLYWRTSRRNISFRWMRKVKNIGTAFTLLTWKKVQRPNRLARNQ